MIELRVAVDRIHLATAQIRHAKIERAVARLLGPHLFVAIFKHGKRLDARIPLIRLSNQINHFYT